jgi:hypothetical protein
MMNGVYEEISIAETDDILIYKIISNAGRRIGHPFFIHNYC